MTRARERLLLSGAVEFERWPAPRQGGSAISWLGPALAAELPALAQALQPARHELVVGPLGGVRVGCILSAPGTFGDVFGEDAVGPRAAPAPVSAQPAAPLQLPAPRANGSRVLDHDPDDGGPPTQAESSALAAPASTLSYTALAELERCGYRYYLERVLGMAENRGAARSPAAGGALDARARGTLVHALLETLDFRAPSAPAPAEVARLARTLGTRANDAESTEIAQLIEAAIAAAPSLRVGAARRVRREYPFAFSLAPEQPLITGVIDLLADEGSGRSLVLDYKSDRVGDNVDLPALVEREYAIQRLLYALAVLRDGAGEVEIVHWFLHRPHEWVGARYAASESTVLEQRLGVLLAEARSQTFSVSPRPHRGLCLTCPGRGGLCSWGDEQTLREDSVSDRPGADAPDALG